MTLIHDIAMFYVEYELKLYCNLFIIWRGPKMNNKHNNKTS